MQQILCKSEIGGAIWLWASVLQKPKAGVTFHTLT